MGTYNNISKTIYLLYNMILFSSGQYNIICNGTIWPAGGMSLSSPVDNFNLTKCNCCTEHSLWASPRVWSSYIYGIVFNFRILYSCSIHILPIVLGLMYLITVQCIMWIIRRYIYATNNYTVVLLFITTFFYSEKKNSFIYKSSYIDIYPHRREPYFYVSAKYFLLLLFISYTPT